MQSQVIVSILETGTANSRLLAQFLNWKLLQSRQSAHTTISHVSAYAMTFTVDSTTRIQHCSIAQASRQPRHAHNTTRIQYRKQDDADSVTQSRAVREAADRALLYRVGQDKMLSDIQSENS